MANLFKLSATGNHFILVDLVDKNLRAEFIRKFKRRSRSSFVREFCNPFHSIGADGLFFLENSKKSSFKWDFYNADGSSAEMCGNAARAIGAYCKMYYTDLDFTLETKAGEISISTKLTKKRNLTFGEMTQVAIEMPTIQDYEPSFFKIKHKGTSLNIDFVNTGVPHTVIKLNSNQNLTKMILDVDNLGDIVNKIRALKRFKANGTNVTFYSIQKSHQLHSFTFERGVTGYTQSCGTGVVAAAVSHLQCQKGKVTVQTPGGRLQVEYDLYRPKLIGPATVIAKFEV